MTVYDVNDQVPLQHKVYSAGALINATTVTVTVTKPDGSTTTPTVTNTSTGVYDATVTTDAVGIWYFRWSVTGVVPTDYVDGQFTVVTSAPPSYTSLAAIKSALGIGADTSRDALLAGVVSAASRYVDRRTGRRFYADRTASARTYRPQGRLVDDRDGQRFLVDDIATTTGLVVEIGASNTYTTVTSYEVGPENALARNEAITWLMFGVQGVTPTWPLVSYSRVRITARWGWPAIPDDVEQATLLYAARLFRRKDSPEGVAGSTEWGAVRVSTRDPDVEQLLSPYILPSF